MSQVRKNYSGSGALNASFDLSIYWSVREREEKKSGELVVSSGDRFRVSLGKEVFVSDGKTYWQYSEKNSQVVVRNFSDIDAATLPSKFLMSFMSTRKFEEKKRGGGAVELAWDGGGKDSYGDGYVAITATVEEKGGIIKVLKLTDKNNNIHTYTFKKTVFDKSPKDGVFQFAAPKGVEVIDMRDENAAK
jgi:outer membrane lipoprotein-sorting protein